MIAALMAAAVVAGLGERPPEFVAPSGIEDYSAWLAQAAIDSDAGFSHETCPDAAVRSISNTPADADLAKDGVQVPPHQGPIIKEVVSVVGCGRTSLQNLVVVHPTTGGWIARRMLPGASLAGGRLQIEALATIVQIALTGPPPLTCTAEEFQSSLRIVDISIVSFTKAKHTWAERWSIQVCGANRPITVTFTTLANDKVSYNAKPAW